MAYSLPVLRTLGPSEMERFREDGFVVIESVLDEVQLEALRASLPKLFSGEFDTGVYPDEWYWREGMSLPDVTRHMANAWKADLTVAKLALSADIGRAAAQLSGWTGARLGQDTIWWKPPKTKAVSFHQDSSYMDFLDPPRTITCWVVLDQTHRDAGTLGICCRVPSVAVDANPRGVSCAGGPSRFDETSRHRGRRARSEDGSH